MNNIPDYFLNKIICGDCLEIMKDIPNKSIDMILCDLPYEITACSWDCMIDLDLLRNQVFRILKPKSPFITTSRQPFTSKLVMSNLKYFRHEWIWDKVNPTGFQVAKFRPMMQHESVLVFSVKSPNYYPIKIKRDKEKKSFPYSKSSSSPLSHNDKVARTYTDLYPKSIIKFSNADRTNRFHSTQKPIPLFEYLIETYSIENDIILDCCVGSGTTAVACKNLGRNFIGIDISEQYCNIARQRLEI